MRKLGIICVLLIGLIISQGAVTAEVNDRYQLVSAFYQNAKLIVNGRLLNTPVEPFQIGEGHLMVPVRTIAEALGQVVEWDEENKIVYIDSLSSAPSTTKTIPAYIEELPVLRNVGPFFRLVSRPIAIAGRNFNHGLVVEVAAPQEKKNDEEENNPSPHGEAVLDLNGQYTWLEGYLGVDDETRNSSGGYTIHFYGDGLLLYQSGIIKASEYPFQIRVMVQNIKRLSVQIQWVEAGIGDNDRVCAALANFQVY